MRFGPWAARLGLAALTLGLAACSAMRGGMEPPTPIATPQPSADASRDSPRSSTRR